MTEPQFFTPNLLADLLGLPEARILCWIREGRIPFVHLEKTTQYVIPRRGLDEALADIHDVQLGEERLARSSGRTTLDVVLEMFGVTRAELRKHDRKVLANAEMAMDSRHEAEITASADTLNALRIYDGRFENDWAAFAKAEGSADDE